MATFVKRKGPAGRWVWQVRVRKRGYPPRAYTFSLKANAEAWAKQLEREIEAGRAGARSAEAERTMLAEAVTRYEREILPRLWGESHEIARLRRLRSVRP